MLNVFCLWVGNKYPVDYVKKLNNMVKANLALDHKFICLTDKPNLHKIEGIEFRQAPVAIADSWCKLSLFTPQLTAYYQGKALYLDLDIVITGKLDGMIEKCDTLTEKPKDEYGVTGHNKTFYIIKDWWRDSFNSSVMIWELGKWNEIYSKFKPSDINRLKGDQDLITEVLQGHDVKTFGAVEIQSYKANNLIEGFNKHTKIVVFHGKPKPHEVKGWVIDYWK
jgi:lipopolysaccharide biosynthesis glycosyltransferase